MNYYNWHRAGAPAAPYTKASPNLMAISHYMDQTYGMWFLGCYVHRRIRGGTRWSSHAFGAGLDLSYRQTDDQPDVPTRDSVETVIIPWLQEHHETLGIQRIHDYWAKRYWQVGKGWVNRPPGGRNDHIHLEVNNETWHWDTDIDGRLTDGPPAKQPVKIVADAPEYPGASTRRGSSAKARVRLIQQALADKGYKNSTGTKPLVVDGDFGPATENAVKEFQNDAGEYVDGIVGPKTWAALFG